MNREINRAIEGLIETNLNGKNSVYFSNYSRKISSSTDDEDNHENGRCEYSKTKVMEECHKTKRLNAKLFLDEKFNFTPSNFPKVFEPVKLIIDFRIS